MIAVHAVPPAVAGVQRRASPVIDLNQPQSDCRLSQELIPPTLPIVSVSKGIEVTSGQLMSEVIPSVLGKKQPTVYLSGRRFVRLGWCGVVKFG